MAGNGPASGAAMHGGREDREVELSSPIGGILLVLVIMVLGLFLWEVLGAAAVVPPFLLPRPSAIGASAGSLAPGLVAAAGQTTVTALAGVIVGSVVAAPACLIAAALATSRAAGAVLFAALWLRDLLAIIVLSLVPPIAMLFGAPDSGIVAAATLGAALALLASVGRRDCHSRAAGA